VIIAILSKYNKRVSNIKNSFYILSLAKIFLIIKNVPLYFSELVIDNPKIYKVRKFACRSLKGKGVIMTYE